MAGQIRPLTKKILFGAEGVGSIGEFLNVSKPTVYKLIKMGMPVFLMLNKYHAHSDNIEEWFRRITIKQYQDPEEE